MRENRIKKVFHREVRLKLVRCMGYLDHKYFHDASVQAFDDQETAWAFLLERVPLDMGPGCAARAAGKHFALAFALGDALAFAFGNAHLKI